MEIKTIEGKDYLVSSVVTGKYRWADTTKLFDDMWEFIELLREYHKTDTMVKFGYGSNVEHIYRKYNTDYFSPTFLKSFNENPFGSLIHEIYNTGEMNIRGVNFHKVMELYYQLPKGERTREKAVELTKEVCTDGSYEKVLEYVDYYFNRHLDYLGGELDDNSLECLTEHKGKCDIFVKSLGKKLPMKMKYIIDRLDYRDDKIYLIDYKTGSPTAEKCNDFKGYLPQMTMYRWAIENEFDMEIAATYLNIPKKVKDFYVKVNRSKKIDEVVFSMCEQFCKKYERFKRERLLYPRSICWCDNYREKEIVNNMAKGIVGTEEEILIPLGETNNDIKDFIID